MGYDSRVVRVFRIRLDVLKIPIEISKPFAITGMGASNASLQHKD